MITKIILDVATYKSATDISNLKAVNFFYGANGAGKSTIASYLNSPYDLIYSKCTYEPNPISDKIYVFNKKFVEDNFKQKNLNGIYRFGGGDDTILEEIDKLQNEKKDKESLLETANTNLTTKKNEQLTKETWFTNFCWTQSENTRKEFSNSFTGYLKKGKETEFKNYLINNHLKKNAQTHDLDSLKQRYKTLHTDELLELPEIPHQATHFPNYTILQENIIGKQDVDISALIETLNNQDWVKKGKEYLQSDDTQCPFCQKTIDDTFKQQLNAYFDDSYNQKIAQLNNLKSQYDIFYDAYESSVDAIIEHKFLDINQKNDLDKIKNILEINKSIIEQKSNEASRIFNVKSSNACENNTFINKFIIDENEIDFVSYLEDVINKINLKIRENNNLVKGKKTEIINLKNDIWQYLADTFLRSHYNTYLSEQQNIQKAINGLNGQISNTSTEIKNIETQIKDASKKITNITQTVDEINKSLKSLGFTNFSLAVTDDTQDQYKIIRNSNQSLDNVYDTLSEGEKTLIAFLYFCHLLKGSFEDTANSEPKIIVFDDPISSLDSNNLFYICVLIRSIIKEIDDKCSKKMFNVKQIFVLTHNLYFFNQITYIKHGVRTENKSYYTVLKNNDISNVNYYEKSPVNGSYELLWKGINDNQYDCRNNMRRILEAYLKFTCNTKYEEIDDKFDTHQEKQAYQSLIAFLHDGSHNIIDDYEFSNIDNAIEIYKNVFKKIFQNIGHIAHYNKMMGIEEDEIETKNNMNNIFDQQNAKVS